MKWGRFRRGLARNVLMGSALAAMAGATAGCSEEFNEAVYCCVSDILIGPDLPFKGPKPSKMFKDRYLAAVAGEGPGFQGFVRPPIDLWPDFEVKLKCGYFDPAVRNTIGAGIFGIEFDVRQDRSLPLRYYGMSVQVAGNGLNAFVYSGVGANSTTHDDVTFANTDVLEICVRLVGDQLTFLARNADSDDPFTEVDTVTVPANDLPLNPGIGVFRLDNGTAIGFDCFDIVSRGPPQEVLTPEQEVLECLIDLFDKTAEAAAAIDGSEIEEQRALDCIEQALLDLDAAIDCLEDLPDDAGKKRGKSPKKRAIKGFKKAKKKLKKARKKAKQLVKKLAPGKKSKEQKFAESVAKLVDAIFLFFKDLWSIVIVNSIVAAAENELPAPIDDEFKPD